MKAPYRELLEALRERLPAHKLIDDPLRLLAYGTDASFYRLIPQLGVRPDSEEELMGVLAECRRRYLLVTFRTAGTSLSGQAVTDSVLVQLNQGWRDYRILDAGRAIRLQPGIIGARANQLLAPYGRKIGPDPASINSCMIGGIAANNASGMCCGTAQNSYRTLRDIRVILADGTLLDTADADSRTSFRVSHGELLEALETLGRETRSNAPLAERIRHKYRLKNTTGYALNSLVDFEDGFDILAHLMIGSEGTLGFISAITYDTVPDAPLKTAALAFFPDMATGHHRGCRLPDRMSRGRGGGVDRGIPAPWLRGRHPVRACAGRQFALRLSPGLRDAGRDTAIRRIDGGRCDPGGRRVWRLAQGGARDGAQHDALCRA